MLIEIHIHLPVTACNRPLYETLLLNRDTASDTVIPTKMQELINILNIITDCIRSIGEGCVFTPVCHSVHGGRGWPTWTGGGGIPPGR